jgi:hypothetical protein
MGYTPDYTLTMPARRFFAMNKSRMSLEARETAAKFYELCQIQAIGGVGSMDYFDAVSNNYRDGTLSEKDRKILINRRNKVFDADDPDSIKYAAQVLGGYFNMAVGSSG